MREKNRHNKITVSKKYDWMSAEQIKQDLLILSTKMIEVTPPIEPTVVEKKKFLTPARLDCYLLYLIVLLRVTLFSFDMISVLMAEPTTNTVIIKVKEKVVYKKPVKKVTTNVCNK